MTQSDNHTLSGKTALITGSLRGIGFGIANALAAAGARIALHDVEHSDKTDDALAQIRRSGAPDARFYSADLRDPDQIEGLIQTAAAWSPVDILVNNAGRQATTSLAETDSALWNDVISVNLSASFHTMRLALPGMADRGYGRVINIASVHGLVASRKKSPYVASKFGLIGLSKVAALEYARAGDSISGGVTVNCICPGWVETDLIEPQIIARAAEVGGDRNAGIRSMLEEKQPSLRTSTPAEIGSLAVWLCQPAAHNLTGAAIPVDGGWTAQ